MHADVLQRGLFDAVDAVYPGSVRVIGVGDAGCRAASEVRSRSRGGAEVVCVDTDSASLIRSRCDETVLLGAATLRGFGSGGDREAAERVAQDSAEAVRGLVADTGCVVVVAGLGGGTGSGAAPVIAALAKEAGALVICIAIMPFEFEGTGTHLRAADALDRLRAVSDAVLETPGNMQVGGDSTLSGSMARDRRHVASFASTVISIANASAGQSNLTAAHLRSVLRDGAMTVFGAAEGFGHTGAVEAAEACADAALAGRPPTGGLNRALVLIESGPDLPIAHIATAVATIEARTGAAAELHPGIRRSRLLAGTVRVSLIGTLREVRRPLIFSRRGFANEVAVR